MDEETKKILDEKEREIESLKEKANLYDEFKDQEIKIAKEKIGHFWRDSYATLDIEGIRGVVDIITSKYK